MERCQLDGEVYQSFSLVYNLMEIVIIVYQLSSAPNLRITFVEFIFYPSRRETNGNYLSSRPNRKITSHPAEVPVPKFLSTKNPPTHNFIK
jgi:hypothetical protein